jgi:hypothetical protein
MGWSENYTEDEIVGDFTKPLSKIWDNLIPTLYPHVLSFKTNKVVEVKQIKKMGPYSMTERFLDYDCEVLIDNKPVVKIGWDGGEISKEMADKAYGENYFFNLRSKLVDLSKYAGLNFNQFDFGGKLRASVNDL